MLVHKSVEIRPEIWKRLRINAELSDAALRDYLSFIIEQAGPVNDDDLDGQDALQRMVKLNSQARVPPVPSIKS